MTQEELLGMRYEGMETKETTVYYKYDGLFFCLLDENTGVVDFRSASAMYQPRGFASTTQELRILEKAMYEEILANETVFVSELQEKLKDYEDIPNE